MQKVVISGQSSIIRNSPQMETTQISINYWRDQQNGAYQYNGILFGHLSNEVLIDATNIMWSDRGQQKDHTVYDSIHIKCPETSNL